MDWAICFECGFEWPPLVADHCPRCAIGEKAADHIERLVDSSIEEVAGAIRKDVERFLEMDLIDPDALKGATAEVTI